MDSIFLLMRVTTGCEALPVPNAHIEISDESGKVLCEASTDAAGIKELEINAPCSVVNVDISTAGFNSERIKNVRIDDTQVAFLSVQLSPQLNHMADEIKPSVDSPIIPLSVWPPYPGTALRRGMQGPNVRLVQERLNELGANPQLSTDSSFGQLTEAAVITFQRANGLTPDGIVGSITWNVLFSNQPAPPPVWPPYPGIVLRRGMQGPSIRQVQERLNDLGAIPRLSTDGVFGPSTESAVMAFQRANGLAVDGIVGSITWNTLFSFNPAPLPNRMIALTFDDGPRQTTQRLLDILEHHNALATFFVSGSLVEMGRDIVARAANMGNEIAGHTWTHADLTQLCDWEIAEELQSTSAVIKSVTGLSSRIYRPPYGFTNSNVRRVSAELGYSIISWTLDTLDWHYRDAEVVYDIIMDNVIDDDIILLHDIHSTTIDAMERVIPNLISRGFQLVTVSELLTRKYGELEPGVVYGNPRQLGRAYTMPRVC